MVKKLFILLSFPLFVVGYYVENPYSPAMIQKGFFSNFTSIFTVQSSFLFDQVYSTNWSISSEKNLSYSKTGELARITATFFHRFSAYALTGANKQNMKLLTPNNDIIELYSTWHVPWVVGGDAIIAEWHGFVFGIDGKYWQEYYRFPYLTSNGSYFASTESPTLFFQNWQVSLALGYAGKLLVPFIGVLFENISFNLYSLPPNFYKSADGQTLSSESRSFLPRVGLVLGSEVTHHDIFSLGVQVRMISETAVTLSLMFGF